MEGVSKFPVIPSITITEDGEKNIVIRKTTGGKGDVITVNKDEVFSIITMCLSFLTKIQMAIVIQRASLFCAVEELEDLDVYEKYLNSDERWIGDEQIP